jgi:hypothetical protein
LFKFFLNTLRSRFAGKFRGTKFSRRKIERRKTYAIPSRCHRCQKIIFLRIQRRIRRRARRHHASYLAPYQSLCQAGIFNLFANRDLEAATDQLRDVAFGGMVRHAAHGDIRAFFFIARGQGDLQFARRQNGVIEEKLVEIPQPEEQQSVGMLFLNGGILPHQRCGGLRHGRICDW